MIDPRLKISTFYRNLIIAFWIVFYIGSSDGVGSWEMSYTPFFFQLFSFRFPLGRGYYGFEWMVVILSAYLLIKFHDYYILKAKHFYYLLTVIVVLMIILVNPNNTDNFFELFLAQDSKFVLLIPLFYCAIFFLRDFKQAQLFGLLFKYGIPITVIHCSIALCIYILGYGPPFLGQHVTILHSDNLQMIGFFHVILVLRLIRRYKLSDLVYALIMMLTLVLSFRRTEVYITLIIDSLLIMVMTIKMRQFALIMNLLKTCVFFIAIMSVMHLSGIINLQSIFQRQVSIFASFDSDLEDPEAYDSRHLEQSMAVSQSVLEKHIFWGGGIQNSEIYLEGQSTRAHSNLAFTAAKYGVLVALYYIFLFIWFARLFIEEFFRSWPGREFNFINLYRLTMLAFLCMFFIAGWASGTSLFDYFAQPYIIFFMWLAMYHIHPRYMHSVLGLEMYNKNISKMHDNALLTSTPKDPDNESVGKADGNNTHI